MWIKANSGAFSMHPLRRLEKYRIISKASFECTPGIISHVEISSETALADISREHPDSQQACSEISSYLSVCEIAWCHPNTGKGDARIFKFPDNECISSGRPQSLGIGESCSRARLVLFVCWFVFKGCAESRGA